LGISWPSTEASAASKIFVRSFLFCGLASVALVFLEWLNEPVLSEVARTNAIVRMGKLPRVVQDGAIIACPNPQFFRDTETVFVQEERKTLDGIELLCLKGWSQGVCYWSLAAEIDVYGRSFLGRLRRSIY
jgi:hypothetical protein